MAEGLVGNCAGGGLSLRFPEGGGYSSVLELGDISLK